MAEPKGEGIVLKHDTLHNQLWVVENAQRPFTDGGYDCNICVGVHHYGKTTHLWLEPSGTCIVSRGVYEELQRAGMPSLTVVGVINNPPPLRIGRNADRQEVDNNNRRIWVPTPVLDKTGVGTNGDRGTSKRTSARG